MATAADTPLLRVRDLTVEFVGRTSCLRAVDGVSFEVAEGETLAVVGESGSGKTATALALMRLLPAGKAQASASEVTFEGCDLMRLPESRMRELRGNRISMIFQDPMSAWNPALTIGKQVAEPIQCHELLSWPSALSRAEELLGSVRIPDPRSRSGQYPHQFSGGMRQRAMVAMALACRPRLVIADEPTTALDVTVQAQILNLLKDLTRQSGASLILVTHDLGVVARYADRVAIMYAGRIVESGSAREVYRQPGHPYTRGLLACVPRLDRPATGALTPIPGQPPSLNRLPSGCAFHPRCPHAMERCRRERPVLEHKGGQHWGACFVDFHR
ncbi:MAG: ABC transporter ATP-binding protein [Hyphomicrobiaceae bacterium]|nr:MAG: ABC transporter ATP-binding protein [Hyphomicrobiaceae bacterium]